MRALPFEIRNKVLGLLLSVYPTLILLVLLRTVGLDELGDKVAIRTVSVSHCAEPVRFLWSGFDLLLRYQGSAISRNLRDKDRVLVDF